MPVDAYTAALTLLARRELSTHQLRERLTRRKFSADQIDETIRRLTADRTLDDSRVAAAAARSAASLKRYGRRRALRHVQQLGVDSEIAKRAVDDVFGELNEDTLLEQAIQRRLRSQTVSELDTRARQRLVRYLVSRGFEPARVFARLRARGAEPDE
jgi:regulatory protein